MEFSKQMDPTVSAWFFSSLQFSNFNLDSLQYIDAYCAVLLINLQLVILILLLSSLMHDPLIEEFLMKLQFSNFKVESFTFNAPYSFE